jgi:hypothetical protein
MLIARRRLTLLIALNYRQDAVAAQWSTSSISSAAPDPIRLQPMREPESFNVTTGAKQHTKEMASAEDSAYSVDGAV